MKDIPFAEILARWDGMAPHLFNILTFYNVDIVKKKST